MKIKIKRKGVGYTYLILPRSPIVKWLVDELACSVILLDGLNLQVKSATITA